MYLLIFPVCVKDIPENNENNGKMRLLYKTHYVCNISPFIMLKNVFVDYTICNIKLILSTSNRIPTRGQ